MSDWQSIDTAPKDGTWVLLFDEIDGPTWPHHMVARFIDGYWKGEGEYPSIADVPTHWMPLPAPPGRGNGRHSPDKQKHPLNKPCEPEGI